MIFGLSDNGYVVDKQAADTHVTVDVSEIVARTQALLRPSTFVKDPTEVQSMFVLLFGCWLLRRTRFACVLYFSNLVFAMFR